MLMSDSIELMPTADFVLRTSDATANTANGNSFTWKNLDIRSVLGDLYYRYDFFQLCLKAVVVTPQGSNPNSNDMKLAFMMEGLQWHGCNYNTNSTTRPPSVTNKSCIGISSLPGTSNSSVGDVYQPSMNMRKTFRKGKEIVSVTIEYFSVKDQVLFTPSFTTFQNFTFMFKIIPLKDFKFSSANMVLMSKFSSVSANSFTWSNYDLRQCLGQLFDLYDFFNIEFLQYTQQGMTATSSGNNNTGQILLHGIPFDRLQMPQTVSLFDNSRAQNNGAGPTNIIANDLSQMRMSKSQLMTNLKIQFWNSIDNAETALNSGTWPAFVIIFKITGIPK